MAADDQVGGPRLVLREQDTLERLLRHAHRMLRRNPAAVRTAVRALVAEGRRFAATPEGRQWQAALASSELVRRGRFVWSVCGFDRLVDGAEQALTPTDWLAFVADVLLDTDLEAMLNRRLHNGDGHGVNPFDPA